MVEKSGNPELNTNQNKLEASASNEQMVDHNLLNVDDLHELSQQDLVNEGAENAAAGGQSAVQDDPDERSVWVKNVDFSADDAQLTEHFKDCGEIVRVTIKKHPHTGASLGYAYIEFANIESAMRAKHLNESLFKGRQLTVANKRKNIAGRGRGMGFGGMRGASNPMAMMMMLMRGMARGMGRGGRGGRGGFRGRGRGGAAPSEGGNPPAQQQQ